MSNIQRYLRAMIPVVLVVTVVSACSIINPGRSKMRTVEVQMRIDHDVIFGDDAFALIEPVWWTANIYDSPKEYEASLVSFSRPQRLFFAIEWYRSEVNNGGHDQFYFNSTGIVWKDALAGFELLQLDEFASILRESAHRLEDPSLDRKPRQDALNRLKPDFNDLDDQFYKLEELIDLDATMLKFASTHPQDFEFNGVVRKPAPTKK